jgi:hypothetical protein
MTYFLFSDKDHWHIEIHAATWFGALMKVKSRFGIKGRLRIVSRDRQGGRDYRVDHTAGYTFTLQRVEES